MNNSLVMGPAKLREYFIDRSAKFIFERDGDKAAELLENIIDVYSANFTGVKDFLKCQDYLDNLMLGRKEMLKMVDEYIYTPSTRYESELKSKMESRLREWSIEPREPLMKLAYERAKSVLRHNL